ncbi:MAG: FMN-dependent NADH-azoreductase [Candidatus Endobugula sp.]|jgi:FMN-dependent NADH-azoreductase
MSKTILQLDSSARFTGSLSREVTQYTAEQLVQSGTDTILHRDLAKTDLPLITEAHIGAYYTPKDERSDTQKQLLAISDELIAELRSADQFIIGAPMYNFSVTAALKAWIDLICRVGETFVYGNNGPEGLLAIERAFIIVSAGGTAIGSDADFSSPYLTQICHFIGIKNVHIIDVSGSQRDPDTLSEMAKQQVNSVIKAGGK